MWTYLAFHKGIYTLYGYWIIIMKKFSQLKIHFFDPGSQDQKFFHDLSIQVLRIIKNPWSRGFDPGDFFDPVVLILSYFMIQWTE